VTLAPGQALTLNGIAQGFATDLVADGLRAAGFTHALVDVGEYRALGGPFRIGVEDPAAGLLASRAVTDGAVATSSPGALTIGGMPHILDPLTGGAARPRWSTVSVEAETAALADGLSTAMCLMDRAAIAALKRAAPGVRRVTLVDVDGNLSTV
jgi:thiamine biosynthesis lipoprotein